MSKLIRAIALTAAAVVAVLAAVFWAAFFESGACVDAGGQYNHLTGACFNVHEGYVPQFARRGVHALWAIFLALTAVPAWLAYRAIAWLGNRRSAAQQAVPADGPASRARG